MEFLASTHLHITSWVIGIILFFVAVMMTNGSKGQKITQMVLRVFYIFILLTGIAMFIEGMAFEMGMLYGFKLLGGVFLIGFMEMILARMKKQKNANMFWILFFIVLFITLFLGFQLPMGIDFL